MNVIDWLTESAKYMVSDNPELYPSVPEAVQDLSNSLDTLREHGKDEATLLVGPYLLYRFVSEGCEEVFLTKKLSSFITFEPEMVCRAYGWIEEIELDDPLDDGLDDC